MINPFSEAGGDHAYVQPISSVMPSMTPTIRLPARRRAVTGAGRPSSEARALFRRYRFAENGGEPFCNRCGCPAAWTYQDGKRYKCKQCLRQFTLTTNTPFAYRKLPFKTILLILAQFNVAYQGRSALEIKRDLRAKVKNYKTIFV